MRGARTRGELFPQKNMRTEAGKAFFRKPPQRGEEERKKGRKRGTEGTLLKGSGN